MRVQDNYLLQDDIMTDVTADQGEREPLVEEVLDEDIPELPYESRPYEPPATRTITTIRNAVLVREEVPITREATIIQNDSASSTVPYAHPLYGGEGHSIDDPLPQRQPRPPTRPLPPTPKDDKHQDGTEKEGEKEEDKFDIDTRVISGLFQCGGNDCYMNSVVQVLCGTDLLAAYFISHRFNKHIKLNIIKSMYTEEEAKFNKVQEEKLKADPNYVKEEFTFSIGHKQIRKRKKKTVSYAFYQLLNYMWSENCKIKPQQFKNITNKEILALRGDNQEDAHEFLTFLFDVLERELRIRCKLDNFDIVTPDVEEFSKEFARINEEVKEEEDKDVKLQKLEIKHNYKNDNFNKYVICEYIESWKNYYGRYGGNYTVISDIFDFPYMTVTECLNCHDKSVRFTPEKCMTLFVPKSEEPVELMDLITKECTNVEELTGSDRLDCDVCGTKQDKMRRASYWSFPERLIIHLKLFEMKMVTLPNGMVHPVMNKLNTKVTCPAEIDLNELKSEYNPSDINYSYELYAMIRHFGSYRGGHYIAYVKNSVNGQWFHFDDASVRPATLEKISGETPFMLLYKRKNVFDSELFDTESDGSTESANEYEEEEEEEEDDEEDEDEGEIPDIVDNKESPDDETVNQDQAEYDML